MSELSYLRLHRGSSSFIYDASDWLIDSLGLPVLSPALYETSTAVWKRAEFESYLSLSVMERGIDNSPARQIGVSARSQPNMDELASLDREAFDSFWHMDRDGLVEAIRSTRSNITLLASDKGTLVGYAVVGAEFATAFLQRIAVAPEHRGQGWGGRLINACLSWAHGRGIGRMVLNVRPENTNAINIYEHYGFTDTGTSLHVLKRDADVA